MIKLRLQQGRVLSKREALGSLYSKDMLPGVFALGQILYRLLPQPQSLPIHAVHLQHPVHLMHGRWLMMDRPIERLIEAY